MLSRGIKGTLAVGLPGELSDRQVGNRQSQRQSQNALVGTFTPWPGAGQKLSQLGMHGRQTARVFAMPVEFAGLAFVVHDEFDLAEEPAPGDGAVHAYRG